MKHLGDITQIKGNEAPIVDCIIGGSPCQDLSLAGKRAGLAGARSGLYMEQIRIIKEMREQDVLRGRTDIDVRPRYMVWENVPGAFSTNGGKDFAAVLEEAIRVSEPEAPDVSVPEKGWPTAGCIMGGCWSVAWRVLDAQFWGVPQRRRRIALVADFGGQSAPEILFVRKSVSGNTEPSKHKRKETTRYAGAGSGAADCERNSVTLAPKLMDAYQHHGLQENNVCGTLTAGQNNGVRGDTPLVCVPYTLKIRSGCEGGGKGALIQTDKSATLSTLQDQTLFQPITFGIGSYHSNAMKSDNPNSGVYVADTSRTLDALNCGYPGCNQGGMAVVYCLQGGGETSQNSQGMGYRTCASYTLNTTDRHAVAYSIENHPADSRVDIDESGMVQTLTSRMGTGGGNVPMVMEAKPTEKYFVRRLTPLECERLQGFPDGWTDIGEWVDPKGKKHKEADSPRYKALGNSIAIPPWKWVLKRLCACYERDATMASLFDGIGGFPYIWEQLNGKGSCLWASEIEEFPMAVTRLRFGG